MNSESLKTYIIFILGCISALITIATSIVAARVGFGMEDVSYIEFVLYSILNKFSSYWLLIIITFIFCALTIFFCIKKIYLLKKGK